MSKEQKLKALQAALEEGKIYTLSEVKYAIKTITGLDNDNLEYSKLVSLYNGGVMLAPCSSNPNEKIAIEFNTPPKISSDGMLNDNAQVQIRHIDFK